MFRTRLPLKELLPALPELLQEAVTKAVPDIDDVIVFRKPAARDVQKVEAGERAAIQWVSTPHVDRAGDIMDPMGCDISEFKLAPQVFFGHYYGDLPIGSDDWIEKTEKGVKVKTVYSTIPFANEVFTLKQEGHLKTNSVGFIRLKVITPDDEKEWTKAVKQRKERWGVGDRFFAGAKRIVAKWKMIEHSDVGVAMNPNALVEAVSKGAIDVSDKMIDALGLTIIGRGSEFTDLEQKGAEEPETEELNLNENSATPEKSWLRKANAKPTAKTADELVEERLRARVRRYQGIA